MSAARALARWAGHGIRLPLSLGALALAAGLLAAGDAYAYRVVTVAGIYALLAIGYQFVFGHAGALSLAQGAFFGLGAYVTGVLGSQADWGFVATFPLSLLAAMALAAVVALPVLRLETHYFALATLGIGQVVLLLAVNWESVTGGANGLPGVPGVNLFGLAVGRGLPMAVLVWGAVAVAALVAWRATRGLYGLAFRVLRENPVAAEAVGLDLGRMRLAAFLASALYGGAAGALYVHTVRVISPEALEFPVMVVCLTIAVVGGRARVAGAVLGALLLIPLPEVFRFLEGYYLLAYGAATLAAVTLAPEGLVGALEALRARLFPEPPAPPQAPRPIAGEVARATPTPRAPVLEGEDLAVAFGGVRALDGVTLALAPGEIVGVIGPNGAGKTTLANLITGLARPERGRVRVGGADMTGAPPFRIARAGVGRTFQAAHLVEGLSALDNVAVARGVAEGAGLRAALTGGRRGADLTRARANAAALLHAMGAGEAAGTRAMALPPGTRRRVEIARALALEPRLLIIDEPAAGSGAAEQADLGRRLRALADRGIALLVIEHNLPFLAAVADRLICLDAGRTIAEGTPDAVQRDPRVARAYLGGAGEMGAP